MGPVTILTAVGLVVSGICGGGVNSWMRERRKGREAEVEAKTTEAQTILSFVQEWGDQFREQNRRIDALNGQVGELRGRLSTVTEAHQRLLSENAALRNENLRLETALHVEIAKGVALAKANDQHPPRRTDVLA